MNRYLFTAMLFAVGLAVASAQTQEPASPPAAPAQPTRANAAAAASQAPTGKAENGKGLFKTKGCYECHGYAGQGGTGPKLGPRPISFAAFTQECRHPRDDMPPYTSKVL